MTISNIINQFEKNKILFENLLINKNEKEFLWRPLPEKWNLLEIVCHLIDEEREDFRARVKHTLENPLKEMPPINPEGWVLERAYKSKNYNEKVLEFLKERGNSITWLKTQVDSNWDNAYLHSAFGEMSAKLFLANWLAHDYLHLRQILRYQYDYLKEQTNIDLQYAGNW